MIKKRLVLVSNRKDLNLNGLYNESDKKTGYLESCDNLQWESYHH